MGRNRKKGRKRREEGERKEKTEYSIIKAQPVKNKHHNTNLQEITQVIKEDYA